MRCPMPCGGMGSVEAAGCVAQPGSAAAALMPSSPFRWSRRLIVVMRSPPLWCRILSAALQNLLDPLGEVRAPLAQVRQRALLLLGRAPRAIGAKVHRARNEHGVHLVHRIVGGIVAGVGNVVEHPAL